LPLTVEIGTRRDPSGKTATIVRLVGELNLASSTEAKRSFAKMIAEAPKVVVFDLAGLSFLDSSGISVLLATRQDIKKAGGTVALTNLQPQIRKVLEIIRSLPGVPIFQSTAELDAYLARVQDPNRADDD
jgi:anti-sigma B factor antagonist